MHSELHLLRHGKSSWDHAELADFDRPLAKRGRKAGKLIAAHLRDAGIEPGAVIYSPAVRAEQTFGLIRAGLPEETPAWHEPRIYGAGWEELLEVVRELIVHKPAHRRLFLHYSRDGDLPKVSEHWDRCVREQSTCLPD